MFKKFVKKTINKLGFDLKRYNLHNKKNEFDDKKMSLMIY